MILNRKNYIEQYLNILQLLSSDSEIYKVKKKNRFVGFFTFKRKEKRQQTYK
jgi:hypothetical protein